MTYEDYKYNFLNRLTIFKDYTDKTVVEMSNKLQDCGYKNDEIKKILVNKIDYASFEWDYFIKTENPIQPENPKKIFSSYVYEIKLPKNLDEELSGIIIDALVSMRSFLVESGIINDYLCDMLVKKHLKKIRRRCMAA